MAGRLRGLVAGWRGCTIVGRWHKFTTCGQVGLRVIIAETSEATCLRETLRKNVQRPATHEFRTGKFHLCEFAAAALGGALPRREVFRPEEWNPRSFTNEEGTIFSLHHTALMSMADHRHGHKNSE